MNAKTSNAQSDQLTEAVGLQPPRYTLRHLFLLVAAVAVCFPAYKWAGGQFLVAATIAGMAIFAHVAGNALGYQLRANGDRLRAEGPDRDTRSGRRMPPRGTRLRVHSAPATNLSHKASLGWIWIVVTLIGAMGGTWFGIRVLPMLPADRVTLSSVTLGATATGVLGAMLAFGLFTLAQVIFSAWRQAHSSSHPRR